MDYSLRRLGEEWAPAGSVQASSLEKLRRQMRAVIQSSSLGITSTGSSSGVQFGEYDFTLRYKPKRAVCTKDSEIALAAMYQRRLAKSTTLDDSCQGRQLHSKFSYRFPSAYDLVGKQISL